MRITHRTTCLPDSGLPSRETCVIDLSGAEPDMPTVIISKHQITGLLRLAHTRSYADQSAPVLVDPRPIWPGPDGIAAVDARCASCRGAKTFLTRGEDQTLLILQHRPGCRELAALAALTGVTP
jgi:hypothetical protein